MPAALDSVLELLLKYRPALFAQGRLALDTPPAVAWGLAALAVLLAVGIALGYRRTRPATGAVERGALTLLRVGVLALLVVCLLRPVLVLSAAVPRRNTVALLVDDSRSMRVADQDGRARGAWARAALGEGSALRRRLEERFAVRVYRFADVARPTDSLAALRFDGDRSRLGAALARVRDDLAGVPVAGVVLVSDGADGAPAALAEASLALRAAGMPVFAVGLGREATAADVEVRRVEAPRRVLHGSAVTLDVVLAHAGLAGRRVPVVVEEDGRIVATQEVTLPAGGDAATVQVTVPALAPGARRLTVRVPRQPGEALAENNARQTLVEVRDGAMRVLYVEGEPRFEAKFVRRAVAGDAGLDVVLLQRTGENKYLRLGVRDSLDLIGGFPVSREELFAYHAVVLGSVEASAFTPEQLRLLADFVSVRGGGLLLLGGRRALAEGGYAGTSLEELIPVVLEGRARGDLPRGGSLRGSAAGPAAGLAALALGRGRGDPASGEEVVPAVELRVRPTPAGAAHAPLRLAGDARLSEARWNALPPLTAVNVARRVRPGATVLLAAEGPGGERRVAMAWQRYGRGRVVAFPVQDSWLWQMEASVAVDDPSHELFWRQTLRWLVAGTPGSADVVASVDRPAPGEAVTVRAEVRDSTFVPVNGAAVTATVLAPSGARTPAAMEWSVARDGEYRSAFTPSEPGVHRIEVVARGAAGGAAGGPVVAAETLHVEVAPAQEEWFESAMRAPVLRRLAAETGGRFYTAATAEALPEDLSHSRAGVTVTERRDLWDMPLAFLLIGGLLAGEWAWRRRRGLA